MVTSAQMTVKGSKAIAEASRHVAAYRAQMATDRSGNAAEALMVAEEILSGETADETYRQDYRRLLAVAASRGIAPAAFNARVRAAMVERMGSAGGAMSWVAYGARELGISFTRPDSSTGRPLKLHL